MVSNFNKLKEFHEKFGHHQGEVGQYINAEEALLRIRLIAEEFGELIKAMNIKDYVEIADAIGDLLYVVYGTGVAYGIPVDAVFAEIHRSNMTKSPDKDTGGKIVKGPNYDPPDIEGILDNSLKARK